MANTSKSTPKVTLAHVARKADTSPSTVSLVLNGRADEMRIPPVTREKVRKAVKELGYDSSKGRRAARTAQRQRAVGIVYLNTQADQSHRHFSRFYFHATLEASQRNFLIHAERGAAPDQLAELVRTRALEGLSGLLLPTLMPVLGPDIVEQLDALNLPYVVVNRCPQPTRPCIIGDDFASGQQQAARLYELGHRHVAYFDTGAMGDEVSLQRYQGVLRAACEAGHADKLVYFPAGMVDEDFPAAAQALLDGHPTLTAAVCRADFGARALCDELERRGLVAPKDFSLISCGERVGAAPYARPIESLTYPDEQMAIEALALLQRVIDRRIVRAHVVKKVPGEAIEGDTIGTAPKQN